MKTHRVLIVSSTALVVSLLLAIWLNGARDIVHAQGPTPTADESQPSTPVPLPPNADGQEARPANRQAADDASAPDSPSNPALSFSYWKVIGTAFQPRESPNTFAYSSDGCIYQTGGAIMRFQAPLILPEQSEIKYVRIYYLDTAATDMTVWLTRYEPGLANVDLVNVKSTGSGGYGTFLSALITQTVDMATYAYVLTWGTSVNSSANQICGVRVAYYAPTVFGTFLPMIQKHP
jgi:hypothetical protein